MPWFIFLIPWNRHDNVAAPIDALAANSAREIDKSASHRAQQTAAGIT